MLRNEIQLRKEVLREMRINEALEPNGIDLYQEIETLIRKNPRAWQSTLAVVGLVGCVIAPLLGAMFDIISWVVTSSSAVWYLHVLSIVFCALTLPLLVLGAHCLDLLEKKSTAQLSTPAPPLPVGATPAAAMEKSAA